MTAQTIDYSDTTVAYIQLALRAGGDNNTIPCVSLFAHGKISVVTTVPGLLRAELRGYRYGSCPVAGTVAVPDGLRSLVVRR